MVGGRGFAESGFAAGTSKVKVETEGENGAAGGTFAGAHPY